MSSVFKFGDDNRMYVYDVEVVPASELYALVEALHRLNVDWDEIRRSCGDPKCDGACRHMEPIDRALASRRTSVTR